MSIFQKKVDELIKKELEDLKRKNKLTDDEANEIYRHETTQAKINRLLEKEKQKNEND